MKKVKSYELRVNSFILTVLRSYGLTVLLLCVFATKVNAQCFLGGGIGFNLNVEKSKYSSETYNHTNSQTYVGFALAPKFGYSFNEKIAIGLNGYGGYNFTVNRAYTITWGINPFFRYTPFTYKNFSLILECGSTVGGAHNFWKIENGKAKNISKTLAIGVIHITPILGFKVTEHLQLEAEVNFLQIGYYIDKTEMVLGEIKEGKFNAEYSTHSFNIGLNSSSILAMTQVRVGVVYKFNKKGGK